AEVAAGVVDHHAVHGLPRAVDEQVGDGDHVHVGVGEPDHPLPKAGGGAQLGHEAAAAQPDAGAHQDRVGQVELRSGQHHVSTALGGDGADRAVDLALVARAAAHKGQRVDVGAPAGGV